MGDLIKIGVLGGTFDPVHFGHLLLAETARERLSLRKVIFIPACIPPHKLTVNISGTEDRLKMLGLAIEDNPAFSLSDIEIKRGGPSYTVDTLRALKRQFPKGEFFFIIGSDELKGLANWRNFSELAKLTKFILAARPGYDLGAKLGHCRTAKIILLKDKQLDISAYDLRRRIKQGLSARYLVPEKVRRYILDKGLYR